MGDDPVDELGDCAAASASGCLDLVGASDRITLVGLVFESAFGLRRQLVPGLQDPLHLDAQAFEIVLRLVRSSETRLRMADLAAQTGLTPSGLTRAVDRLVEVDLVERRTCANDRRGAYAQLTERGRHVAEEAVAHHVADIDRHLDGVFSSEEETALVALLRRLRDRVNPLANAGGATDVGAAPSRR